MQNRKRESPGLRGWLWVVSLAALLAAVATSAQAQFGLPGAADRKVAWTATAAPAKVAPGQPFTLKVTAEIAPSWHIYAQQLKNKGPVPTTFEVTLPGDWKQEGPWTPSKPPEKAMDPGFQFEVGYHNGTVDFATPIRVSATATAGAVEIKGRTRSQACDATMCLPPMWSEWKATVEVTPAGVVTSPTLATPAPAATGDRAAGLSSGTTTLSAARLQRTPSSGQAVTGDVGRFTALQQEGLGAFLVFAMLAGFASLLTPCVFPMVPITVSFFTKRTGRTPRQGIALAFLYAVGIVVTFSLLGLALSAVLGFAHGVSGANAANWIAASPWVNLVLTGLFVFFALSLFGLFDIQLPPGLANKLQQVRSERSDIAGALIMAVVFTLTSFTCTVQFVGLLLVQAARGSWLWPGIGMVVYSAAFASPFFLLALFPQALSRLPRSGPWLHSTKVLMGFLELAAAFKFLSNSDLVWGWGFFDREVVLAAWAVIAFFSGLYLLGKIHMGGEPSEARQTGTVRLLLSMTFMAMGLYLASGLAGVRLQGLVETYLPPRIPGNSQVATGVSDGDAQEPSMPAIAGGLTWIGDYEAGVALAKKENRPVFIDFTGVTCTNCRWMEINVFSRPEIQDLLRKYVRLQLYTDAYARADEYQRLQAERFGTVALPFYVILRPDGSVVDTQGGIVRNPQDFADFLKQGLAS